MLATRNSIYIKLPMHPDTWFFRAPSEFYRKCIYDIVFFQRPVLPNDYVGPHNIIGPAPRILSLVRVSNFLIRCAQAESQGLFNFPQGRFAWNVAGHELVQGGQCYARPRCEPLPTQFVSFLVLSQSKSRRMIFIFFNSVLHILDDLRRLTFTRKFTRFCLARKSPLLRKKTALIRLRPRPTHRPKARKGLTVNNSIKTSVRRMTAVGLIGAVTILALPLAASTTASADWCGSTVEKEVRERIDREFHRHTADLRQTLQALRKAGLGSTPIYRKLDTAYRDGHNKAHRQANGAIHKAANDCRNELKPVQDVVDYAVAAATGGLSLILPKRMTHIDMGEILSGNILGGKNSFFRKQLGIKW